MAHGRGTHPRRHNPTPPYGRLGGKGTTTHPEGDEGWGAPEGKASARHVGKGPTLGERGQGRQPPHRAPRSHGRALRQGGHGEHRSEDVPLPRDGACAARRAPLPTVDLQASQKVSSVKRSMRLVLPTPRDPMMITCSLKSAGRGGCFLRRDCPPESAGDPPAEPAPRSSPPPPTLRCGSPEPGSISDACGGAALAPRSLPAPAATGADDYEAGGGGGSEDETRRDRRPALRPARPEGNGNSNRNGNCAATAAAAGSGAPNPAPGRAAPSTAPEPQPRAAVPGAGKGRPRRLSAALGPAEGPCRRCRPGPRLGAPRKREG